jgi:predicted ATPase
VERALFHLPTLRPAAHIAAVIDIVRQVQGLPLAIEMAAAWVRLLPPQEIARELRGSI